MRLDDETWERLNAYADGELDHDDAATIRARLQQEPSLQAALDDITELSAALKPLHPATPQVVVSNSGFKRRHAGVFAALAATLALLAGAYLLNGRDQAVARTPLDWHRAFASQSFALNTDEQLTPAAQLIGRDLDLSSANLTLVNAMSRDNGDVYLHYAGVNGCRLTLGAIGAVPDLPAATDRLQIHTWAVDKVYYALLAEGMDAGKFEAVTDLLENLTGHTARDGTLLVAVRAATQQAVPCA